MPSSTCFADQKERRIVHIQRGSLRACTLAFSKTSLNKRHDLYLIASLWVVATQVRASWTIFELSGVTSSWSESSRKCSTAFKKASFRKKVRGKRALVSQLCRVRARASTGRSEESKEVLDSLVADRYTQYYERLVSGRLSF